MNAIESKITEAAQIAEFNEVYFGLILDRYQRYQFWWNLALALGSGFAVIGVKFFPKIENNLCAIVGASCSLISTLILPLFKWRKLEPKLRSERIRWIQLKQDYQNLLSDCREAKEWSEANQDYLKIRKRDNALEADLNDVPDITSLNRKARRIIVERWGIVE